MSGLIPPEFIDELLARTDIIEVIDARVPLKKKGREYQACCPFHGEKTPSFTVSPTKQFYHCFGCGAHGTALGFLMEYEHQGFVEAVEELAQQAGIEVPRQAGKSNKKPKESEEWYKLMTQSATFYQHQLNNHPQRQVAQDYIASRGLNGEVVEQYGIGYSAPGWDNLQKYLAKTPQQEKQLATLGMLIEREGDKASSHKSPYYDRFRERIMFPIRDSRGRTIGFGGRILGDGKPKYLNSPETPLFHKGRELYGLFEARQALRDIPRLMVVEGYMDVVSLAQFDIRYAVATLGTATTADHLNKLFRISNEVVFCFDGDRAGRDAAWRALENALPVMDSGRQAKFMFLPDGEDPDTLVRKEGKEAFEMRLEKAQSFSDFLFSSLSSQVSMATLDGRAQLVELAKPLLEKVPDGVFKQMMQARLAELAKMETGDIQRLMAGEANGPVMSSAKGKPGKPTMARRQEPEPVRKAIHYLLNYPEWAMLAGDPERFEGIEQKHLPELVELLDFLQIDPNITTARVMQRYQSTPLNELLESLIKAPLPEAEESVLKQEYLDTLALLTKRKQEQRWQWLLQKDQESGLTADEKLMFMQLAKVN